MTSERIESTDTGGDAANRNATGGISRRQLLTAGAISAGAVAGHRMLRPGGAGTYDVDTRPQGPDRPIVTPDMSRRTTSPTLSQSYAVFSRNGAAIKPGTGSSTQVPLYDLGFSIWRPVAGSALHHTAVTLEKDIDSISEVAATALDKGQALTIHIIVFQDSQKNVQFGMTLNGAKPVFQQQFSVADGLHETLSLVYGSLVLDANAADKSYRLDWTDQ